MKKLFLLSLAACLLGALAMTAGCGSAPDSADTQATEPQVLRVGMDASYPPFGSQNQETKDYEGFDVDIIRAIAAGKVAAANIDEYLGYHHVIDVGVEVPTARLNNKPPHGRINTTERQACERKCDFEDIECGLTEEGAVTEASRCLRCDHFGYGIFRGGRDIKW